MPTYTDPWLEKIRRRASGEPSKPSKAAFGGFGGEGVACSEKISPTRDEGGTPFEGFEGSVSAHLENFTDKPTEATRKTFKSLAPTWRLADIPADHQAAEARRRLDSQGWVGILARRIGDDAVVLLAEDPAKVTANLARRWPVFTLREIEALSPDGIEAAKAAYAEKLAALGSEPHA